MSARRHARLVRAPRVAPRLARLALDDDGRPARRVTHRGRRADRSSRLFMHLLAYLDRQAVTPAIGPDADKRRCVVMTGTLLLSWSLMVSQAMESVTRAFYARSDLDLILSSPAPRGRVFAVRIADDRAVDRADVAADRVAVHQRLAARGGARWLAAYGVVVGVGARGHGVRGGAHGRCCSDAGRPAPDAAGRADHRRGHRRRLRHRPAGRRDPLLRHPVADSTCSSRPAWSRIAPDADSLVWLAGAGGARRPQRAAAVLGVGLLLLVARRSRSSARALRRLRHRRRGVSRTPARRQSSATGFRPASPGRALRRKEWLLLRRDPWLMSQIADADALSAAAGVAAVARLRRRRRRADRAGAGAGHGGGPARRRARLAISGEDAPELVATAPVRAARVRAKVEAVLGAIALVFAPFLRRSRCSPYPAARRARHFRGGGRGAYGHTSFSASFDHESRP